MRRAVALALAAALAAGAAAAEPCDEGMGVRVCFEGPTSRYGHGVLGGTPEWSRLAVEGGPSVELPEDRVFEDLAPRIVDVGGDGRPDFLVVESSATGGAQLAVYGESPGGLIKTAATPEIGTRYRWLAPAAWRDLDDDGAVDFVYVDRPHVAGVLRVWSFAAGGLDEVDAVEGLSNHRIGDAAIASAVRDCGEGPEIVMPDFGWTGLRAVRFVDRRLEVRTIPGEASLEGVAGAARAC